MFEHSQLFVLVKFPVEMYSKWIGNEWQPPIIGNDTRSLNILIQDCHLLVVLDTQVLESVSLMQSRNQAEAVCKNETMAVEAKIQGLTNRFRLKFFTRDDAEKCLSVVQKYITTFSGPKLDRSEICTMPQLLAKTMETCSKDLKAPDSIPDEYPLEAAIQLCILDPGFPSLLKRIENILERFKESD
ncbi:uncharacterized protein LOC106661984 [Cimex lectularius]|uniref:Uncharacterized protein n=1 Tax=Cimex lectularius TaxID=79782 RepID=A0A8I6R9V2_CIMLE|nr:uncharacterized protein LOC106661984 [Cimex lectularius]